MLRCLALLLCLAACRDKAPPPAPVAATDAATVADATSAPDAAPPVPFWQLRSAHQTRLTRRGPSPQANQHDMPEGFQAVTYPSGDRTLRAWLAVPASKAGARVPAVVYLHDGFALSPLDAVDAEPFRQAGFVVLLPSYRGENGNPGDFEMFLGELDDAVAAVRWLATRPGVDPARIYVFGHSAGGLLASLIALVPDVPVVATGGVDSLYDEQLFADDPRVPFDAKDRAETQVRLFLPHVASLLRPHHAYLASQGGPVHNRAAADRAARAAGVPLTTQILVGDHFSIVAPAAAAFIDRIRDDLRR